MSIEQYITSQVTAVVEYLYGPVAESQIQIQKTRKEFEGDFTLVVFPLVKMARKSPEAVATEIGEKLVERAFDIASFNVIKGFLNISLTKEFWATRFENLAANENYGVAEPTGRTIMIEYSSPNTNKPLHLGHIRNNLLGYSVAQILAANGHNVIKANLVNDRGIHICKSMVAWLRYGNGATPESTGKKGDHLVGDYYVEFDKHYKAEIKELVAGGMSEDDAKKQAPILLEAQEMLRKWEAKDAEVRALWEKMNGWVYDGFDVTYKTLGVDFDKVYYESQTYLLGKERVEEGLKKGVFFRKEDNFFFELWKRFFFNTFQKCHHAAAYIPYICRPFLQIGILQTFQHAAGFLHLFFQSPLGIFSVENSSFHSLRQGFVLRHIQMGTKNSIFSGKGPQYLSGLFHRLPKSSFFPFHFIFSDVSLFCCQVRMSDGIGFPQSDPL